MSQEEADEKFLDQRTRDEAKKKAAEEAGWTYVVFKYDEDITLHNLLAKINSHEPDYAVREETPELDPREAEQKEEQLERARQYRKRRYQWFKRWRKKNADRGRS
jgi:hypothetical protein